MHDTPHQRPARQSFGGSGPRPSAAPRRRCPPPATAIALLGAALSTLAAADDGGQAPASGRSGAELYRLACAGCHGSDGRGATAGRVTFETPLPDFTDCRFAQREADSDWLAIAHDGGPARAFDRTMPAFGEALGEEQLRAIVEYMRGFCADQRWPRGELNLPRALVTEKAYPEDEFVFTVGAAAEGPGEWSATALYERRVGPRSMFEVALPVGTRRQTDGGWAQAVGDIKLGFKHALHHDVQTGSILSLGGELVLPTGSRSEGIGTGVTRFEPYVAYGQLLPGSLFLQAQAGVELSADRERAQHEVFWRTVLGGTWTTTPFGRTVTPMLELLAAHELEDGAPTEWALLPQVQVSLSRRQHVLANVGVQVPMNETRDRNTRVFFYLVWDWFDGGLFEGW